MKRSSYIKINAGIGIDLREENASLPFRIMDMLFNLEDPADPYTLFSFYYYTSKWQRTEQVKATNYFVMNKLNWSEKRVIKTRKTLLNLGLIQTIQKKGEHGEYLPTYVKLNFNVGSSSLRQSVPAAPQISGTPQEGMPNALNPSYLNALNPSYLNALNLKDINNRGIFPKNFQTFWEAYPNKASKGAALTAFNKLCKRKGVPSLKVLLDAIEEQKTSQRWQNPIYIPHASTWLNNNRWLDDPKEMISYSTVRDSKGRNKPAKILEYGKWWDWSERDECYLSTTGERLVR